MSHPFRAWLAVAIILAGGCQRPDAPARTTPPHTSLTIGLGAIGTGAEGLGVRQVARNQAVEPLIKFDPTGRPVPFLAEAWKLSDDGLQLQVTMKPLLYQDGSPVLPDQVVDSLRRFLPQAAGPLWDDVASIEAVDRLNFSIRFKRRTAFAVDLLDIQVSKPGAPGIGTGPFAATEGAPDALELKANPQYHLGKPALERILLKPYPSMRAAWADLLRGQVDMLYEVGVEAMESLEPSSRVRLYSFERPYATVVVFNMRKPALRDAAFRRALNSAVDRDRLVADALGGLGKPAFGPIWPTHWALKPEKPTFDYEPERVAKVGEHISLTCIFPSAVSERLALMLQRQLQSIGVDLHLQSLSLDDYARRMTSGDFDLLLTEVNGGPSLIRPYLFWHTGAPYNLGNFSSPAVDGALDAIRTATDDEGIRQGVLNFEKAIGVDPPAIFLAWSRRARALSAEFAVPSEAGRDIVNAIHLWRPLGSPVANLN